MDKRINIRAVRGLAGENKAVEVLQGLNLLERIELCVALLEPACLNPRSELSKAVEALKGLY